MKIALTIPSPLIYRYGQLTDIHLILPQLWDDDYARFFRERSEAGDYVILDNGAAEGHTVEFENLHQKALEVGAHEVVVPDVIGDSAATVALAAAFYDFHVGKDNHYDFMLVPQGANRDDWLLCFEQLSAMYKGWSVVYGIPKFVTSFVKRHVLAEMLERGGHTVHYLGCGAEPFQDIREAPDNVRSIDSSLPFALAQEGVPLTREFVRGDAFKHLTDFEAGVDGTILTSHNVDVLLSWPKGKPMDACCECPLLNAPFVPCSGPDKVDLAIIGEAPGAQEVKDGFPFAPRTSGRMNAGTLLWHCLSQIDIKRGTTFLGNVVSCRPPNNATPTPAMQQRCVEYLRKELVQRNPKVVLTLGNPATRNLVHTRMGITNARLQSWQVPELPEAKVVATFHPAAVLRNGTLLEDMVSDLERVYELLHGKGDEDVHLQYLVVETLETLEHLRDRMPDTIAVDTETVGFDPSNDNLLCISIAWAPNYAVVIPDELLYSDPKTLSILRRMFRGRKQIYHNGKFDVAFLHTLGVAEARIEDDTMLMAYAVDERRGTNGLKWLSRRFFRAPNYDASIHKYVTSRAASYADVPRDVLYPYAARDAYYTLKLRDTLRARMDKTTHNMYRELLIRASDALYNLERRGLLVDADHLDEVGEQLSAETEGLTGEMREMLSDELFNPRSAQQVGRALDSLRIPRTGSSTDKESLEAIEHLHPFPKLMLRHRRTSKLLSSYVNNMYKHLRPDGRVHPTYLIHGTVTGRLAARNPAIQTIPREGAIRGMFCAPDGWVIVQVDYKQHEFRCVAYYSGDEWLLEIFRGGRDLHGEAAAVVYGPDYTYEDRVQAKMINFGLLYGRTAFSLGKQMGVSTSEAQLYLNRFFERMPQVVDWQKKVRAQAMSGEPLETVFGRRRRFGLVSDESAESVMKEGINFYPQSTASDITLLALIALDSILNEEFARAVAIIHDEIVFEVREDVLKKQCAIIKRTMEQIPRVVLDPKPTIPFPVDITYGKRWGVDTKELVL